jgi:hypothetical protein
MRPFFDASEFPRPTFVKEEHRYQGLRYNCTLNSQCPRATWTAGYGGAGEKVGNNGSGEEEKGKSDATRPHKQDEMNKLKLVHLMKAVVGREAVCACA